MGSVKIDFKTKEKPFHDMSYSSVEDLEKIIFTFDLIEQEKNKFNHEALAVFLDVQNLVDPNKHEIIHEYILIQTGKKPLTYYEDNTLSAIAERKKISTSECKKRFVKELKNIIKINKGMWLDSLLNTNIYHIKDKLIKGNNYADWDERNKSIDFINKYIVPQRKYPKIMNHMPDLDQLVDFQKHNEQIIFELESIAPLKRSQKQQDELNIRINWRKELSADIKEIKFHYGLTNENKYAKNTNTATTVESESFLEYDILDEWEIQRINNIANERLTKKQNLIFNLYFNSEFTQDEIAEIVNDTQGNVSRDIKAIKSKIKKYMQI